MADRSPVRRLSVRLPQEDFQWLAGFARQENVSAEELTEHAVWFLRMWEETIKDTLLEALDGIDDLHREHHQELTQLRQCCKQRRVRPDRAEPTPLYGPRIGKLLDLAVSTNSESEASAAFAKARALHHPAA